MEEKTKCGASWFSAAHLSTRANPRNCIKYRADFTSGVHCWITSLRATLLFTSPLGWYGVGLSARPPRSASLWLLLEGAPGPFHFAMQLGDLMAETRTILTATSVCLRPVGPQVFVVSCWLVEPGADVLCFKVVHCSLSLYDRMVFWTPKSSIAS